MHEKNVTPRWMGERVKKIFSSLIKIPKNQKKKIKQNSIQYLKMMIKRIQKILHEKIRHTQLFLRFFVPENIQSLILIVL